MMRKGSVAIALLLSVVSAAHAAPLTCNEAITAYEDTRDLLGASFGSGWGPDVFADWRGNDEDFRFNPPGTTGVEVTIACAADDLFEGIKAISTWEGGIQPNVSEWTAAQLPVDVMASAILGDKLGPNLADLVEEAISKFAGDSEVSVTRRINDVFEARVTLEPAGNLHVLGFEILRTTR